ncbi:hypothetical protein PHYPSEUDO_010630 [Phytophthora pseudosyringae]|uniref:Uncharacterized protein n=1 Tax=Phytophthora pseudosyringae TaxID=221518 RepID=A0A8T1W7G0_9STRA|nr:hypothetical protein PHYPSEUDO_010630 [Phytophthora pseudosyringae]
MDSTGVYDSGNAGDSESWSSSEGEEQVIEITSHSRILISPRKTRGSVWGNKSQCSGSRHVSKRKATRARQEQDEVKSPSSRTSRHSFPARKSGKSCWAGSPRKTPSDNQPLRSNNRGDISGSDGDLASSQDDSASAGESDASFESDVETPVHGRISRAQYPKGAKKATASNSYKYLSSEDSMPSLGSPTTPGKEMAELKATLKKLADHDDSDDNPRLQKEPNISSATALHEYLAAATAFTGVNAVTGASQTRPGEHTRMKTRPASLHLPPSNVYKSNGLTKTKSKSVRENGKMRRDSPADKLAGTTGTERLTFNKKLFSTPPPPFGGPGAYDAGLAFPPQKSSLASGGGGISSGGGGAQGSRAVLSALKALQDKIGRLEEERESLMQQLSDAKLTARKREAELASTEKKFSYELGQTKESARAAYDALRCDREELKLQLVKSEERRKATQSELQHFQELAKNLSAKAEDLQSQLQISESHRTRLKAEMKESEGNHKRVVNELQTELTQVHQEQETAIKRNELLEAQFQRESTTHAESRERLKDSEQTVASISQLNEKLVTKVMEATDAANQAMKKNKKLQQQIRPSTLLRPTAASRASAAAASEATSRRAANSMAAQGGNGVSPARTLKKKKTSTGTTSSTTTKKPKKAKSTNNMTLLREANLGKEIPFLLGNSVQPSFSIIGNIQDALRRCDTTYVMPTLLSGAPTTPSSHQQTARNIHRSIPTSAEVNRPEEDTDIGQQVPSSGSVPTTPTDKAAATAAPLSLPPKSTPETQRRATKHMPPAIKVPTVSPKAYASPMQSQIMEDLHVAVASAEKEFKGLNKRYKDLVAQMEANNRRDASGSEGGKSSSSTTTQLSQALGPLLDELEAKAKQLNLLKQVYQQAASSTINPQRHVVLSPEAIRRKTASLRVLNEYRQLESDFKNKGSGSSATPRNQFGATGFFR